MEVQNVVTYRDDEPRFELTGDEIGFPLTLDQGGVEVVAHFIMSAQIPAHEIKNILDDMMHRYKANEATGERELEPGDDTACRALIDRNFVTIAGVEGEPTKEELRAFLDANPLLKVRLFTEGYDRVLVDTDDIVKPKLVIGAGPASIRAKRVLYSPLRDRVESVSLKHIYTRETEQDRIRYRRAGKQVERGRFTIFRLNWDQIGQMYDTMIQAVEGMEVAGEPCTAANKADWVARVPFNDKAFVVMRIFSRTAVKNA